jgi:predicted PurR-regulated permease PerM
MALPEPGFLAKYRTVTFAALLSALLLIGLVMLKPFYPAILWASVMAVLLTPIHRKISVGKNENLAAILTTLLALIIVGVPVVLVGAALFFQANEFVQVMKNSAPSGQNGISLDNVVRELEVSLKPILQSLSPDFSLTAWFGEHKQDLLRSISEPAGKAIFSIGYTIFTLVVALLTMFFMLRDGHRLREPALQLLPLPRDVGERLLQRLSDTIRAVFVGIVLVAIVQGSVAGVAYWAVGVPQALLWGVATIVLCMIPLVGAPILYIPMSLLLISQGKTVEAIVLLAVGFVIVSNIDNILRPFIIGAKVDLHPMAVFFSLLGGVFLLGPVGIMAGPMLLAVVLVMVDALRERTGSDGSIPEASAGLS